MKFNILFQRFEKIKEEWKKDTQIDFQFKNKEYSEDLARLALEIPFQHNKYLNHYTDISQLKTSLEFEHRKLIKERREYYGGEADAKIYAEKPFGKKLSTISIIAKGVHNTTLLNYNVFLELQVLLYAKQNQETQQ